MSDPDLFTKKFKVEDPQEAMQIYADMVKGETLQRIAEKIEATKTGLPGTLLCLYLVQEQVAKHRATSSLRAYHAASKAGVLLHEVEQIMTETNGTEVWVVARMEGGAPWPKD